MPVHGPPLDLDARVRRVRWTLELLLFVFLAPLLGALAGSLKPAAGALLVLPFAVFAACAPLKVYAFAV